MDVRTSFQPRVPDNYDDDDNGGLVEVLLALLLTGGISSDVMTHTLYLVGFVRDHKN